MLAVIALTSVTIGALFGMLLTTINITSRQEQSARALRAADSAIETAIAQMRRNPGAVGGDACAVGAPLTAVQQITIDQGNADPGDDITVDVDCAPAGLGDPAATADQVRIVGTDGYQGAMRWTIDCATDATAIGCLPWSKVNGLQASAADSGTSLVHTGHEPLGFSSGVTVRTGAVTLRTRCGTALRRWTWVASSPRVTPGSERHRVNAACWMASRATEPAW